MAVMSTGLDLALPKTVEPGINGSEALLPADESSRKRTDPIDNFVEIVIDPVKDTKPKPQVSLLELRTRYSCALTRAGVLLYYHAERYACMGASEIVYLLESITAGEQCRQLDSGNHLNTHQPQLKSKHPPVIFIPVTSFGTHRMEPSMVGDIDGLLVGLLRILDSGGVQSPPALELAAVGALGFIAAILLKQWLKMTLPHAERKESEHGELSEASFSNWPMIGYFNGADNVKIILTHQVMCITIFAVSHARCPGIDTLPEQAVLALFRRFQVAPSHFAGVDAYNYSGGIDRLIRTFDSNSARLDEGLFKSLVDILLLKHKGCTLFQDPGIVPVCIVPFLRVLCKVTVQASELQALLDVIAGDVQKHTSYLTVFMDSEAGFSSLVMIGERDEYRLTVAKCVAHIINAVAAQPTCIATEAQTVIGSFNALAFALEALALEKDNTLDLLASARTFVNSLCDLPGDTLHTIATSKAAAILSHTLRNTVEHSEAQSDLLSKLEELDGWLHAYDLPVEGLGPFFEQGLGVSMNHVKLTAYILMAVLRMKINCRL